MGLEHPTFRLKIFSYYSRSILFYIYILRKLLAVILPVFITYNVIIVVCTFSDGYSCPIAFVLIMQGGTLCLSAGYTL